MRTSTRRSRVPPTRRTDRLSSTRSSRGCSSSGSSPISSRNSVPPAARSNAPACSACAPVNEPFSWPKSSLSIRLGGTAPQSKTTNGPRARGLASWIARASTSLPVPVSPISVSVTSLGARRSRSISTSTIAGDCATTAAERRRARGGASGAATGRTAVAGEGRVVEWIGSNPSRRRPELHDPPIQQRRASTCDVCAEGFSSSATAARG